MEEAKREIVEGKNFKRKNDWKNAMVIESESDQDSEKVTPIGTTIEEIDAYYNKMIAEFGKKSNPISIENDYKLGAKVLKRQPEKEI